MGNDDKADGNIPTGKSEDWHDYDKPGDFRIRDETPPKTGTGGKLNSESWTRSLLWTGR